MRAIQHDPVAVEVNGDVVTGGVVFIAAGAWTRGLLKHSGLDLPVVPLSQTRFTTSRMPGIRSEMPLILVKTRPAYYIREENGGLLIGGNELEIPAERYPDVNNPPTRDRIPNGQAYRIREAIRTLEPIMPVLADAEIDQIASGLPTYTKDLMFVADEVPGCSDVYCLTACKEAGVTHGPALARHLTDLAVDATSRWDPELFGIDRFHT